MHKLTRYFPVLLGFGVFGCPAAAPSSFEQAAGEVDDTLVALSEGDPDATFGAVDEIEGDDAQEDVAKEDSDAGTGEDAVAGEHEADGSHRGRRGERPRGRGHGFGLLVWYADLDGLQVCRELRVTCPTSADPGACEEQVKACVRPVLEQAFKAMCDEQVAACDANGQTEKPCEHIREACSSNPGDRSEDSSASGEDDGGHGGDQAVGETDDDSAQSDDEAEHEAEAADGASDDSGAEQAADDSSDTPSEA